MTNRPDLQADFDHGQRALDEMTPLPTWWQRLGWILCVLSAAVAITAGYFVVVWPMKVLLELAFGR